MAFKRDAFWFEVPGRPSVFEALPDGVRDDVKTGLDHMLSLVRGMHNVDAMPPYNEILARLQLIMERADTQQ